MRWQFLRKDRNETPMEQICHLANKASCLKHLRPTIGGNETASGHRRQSSSTGWVGHGVWRVPASDKNHRRTKEHDDLRQGVPCILLHGEGDGKPSPIRSIWRGKAPLRKGPLESKGVRQSSQKSDAGARSERREFGGVNNQSVSPHSVKTGGGWKQPSPSLNLKTWNYYRKSI